MVPRTQQGFELKIRVHREGKEITMQKRELARYTFSMSLSLWHMRASLNQQRQGDCSILQRPLLRNPFGFRRPTSPKRGQLIDSHFGMGPTDIKTQSHCRLDPSSGSKCQREV